MLDPDILTIANEAIATTSNVTKMGIGTTNIFMHQVVITNRKIIENIVKMNLRVMETKWRSRMIGKDNG